MLCNVQLPALCHVIRIIEEKRKSVPGIKEEEIQRQGRLTVGSIRKPKMRGKKSLPFITFEHKRPPRLFVAKAEYLMDRLAFSVVFVPLAASDGYVISCMDGWWRSVLDLEGLEFDCLQPVSDAYGFAVRPQHLQRYREYANIYREEEEERSERWKTFLEIQAESAQLPINGLSLEDTNTASGTSDSEHKEISVPPKDKAEEDVGVGECEDSKEITSEEETPRKEIKTHELQIWAEIRPSLSAIEHTMSLRIKKRKNLSKNARDAETVSHLQTIEEAGSAKGATEDDSEEEFYDVERSDPVLDSPLSDSANSTSDGAPVEPFFPWKEELECLVRGGLPMALRGELWQAFVGVRARRVERYYQDLLDQENSRDSKVVVNSLSEDISKGSNKERGGAPEKWRGQIEKDLPRTFPGHPALDENGRNALRRLLTAYARHNPSVGYCQIVAKAPLKAMNFFAGLLLLLMPEENAFWTLMGIIDDYFDGYYSEDMIESQAGFHGPVGPALVTSKDAGDAVTLLQSLAGSTFDSSQLVLTACMGFQAVNEARLQELRQKHRPAVIAIIEERAKGLRVWKDSQGLAAKLYSFKHDTGSLMSETDPPKGLGERHGDGDLTVSESDSKKLDEFLNGLSTDDDVDSVPDLQEQSMLQVLWLKGELCRLLEEKRSAVLRAEELETALMEMVKQDNRRELSARVEQLELEVAELRQALADKQEQEKAMLQVLMRVEQEQKVTEDARRFAEQDSEAQRYATHVLQLLQDANNKRGQTEFCTPQYANEKRGETEFCRTSRLWKKIPTSLKAKCFLLSQEHQYLFYSLRQLQEKYEEATASLAQMEKRVVMAETMLEATLQYQSGQVKAQQLASPSPRSTHADSPSMRPNQEPAQEPPARKISLLSRPFALGWRDRIKGKPNAEEPNDVKASIEVKETQETVQKDLNGH
ncbi:hypothetical protein ACLOJK_001586 [Asimina triloba]